MKRCPFIVWSHVKRKKLLNFLSVKFHWTYMYVPTSFSWHIDFPYTIKGDHIPIPSLRLLIC